MEKMMEKAKEPTLEEINDAIDFLNSLSEEQLSMYYEQVQTKEDVGKIKAYVDNEAIIIRIPIEILVYAQENRPDYPFKILDEKAMVKDFVDNFIHFAYLGYHDVTNFQKVIDDFFVNAAENAVPWIYDAEGWTGGY